MQYNLGGGVIVKTENAAKSGFEQSAFLLNLLRDLPCVEAALDYGCGKLRYYEALQDRANHLSIVDSEVQLSRKQRLLGFDSTIRARFNRSNRVNVFNDNQLERLGLANFDRATCINVLPIIPLLSVRRKIIKLIYSKLRPGACCLFVVQYRNSDFTRMSKLPTATAWRDGFLLNSLRGYSFYGFIRPERLVAALKRNGYSIVSVRLNEGSAYIWAARP